MGDSSRHMLMEERKELMVSFQPTKFEKPRLRTAHLFNPTIASTETHLPGFPLVPRAINPQSGKTQYDIEWKGWKAPLKGWRAWVDKLRPLHGETWKKAGIFDAIMASTYKINGSRADREFMVKLSEKWSPETNTFVFSWGEATITLEDIMVLGGFPVLGRSVRTPVKDKKMLELEENLKIEHRKIQRKIRQAPRESSWVDHFKGVEDKNFEHQGFLVSWLSRYVFPGKYNYVAKNLFLIAINLSRGIPIALGPAVLANIYRDLGILRNLQRDNRFPSKEKKTSLCSPLGLVQIWAWERFPFLSPKPNPIELGEPRLARWHEKNMQNVADDVGERLDSAEKDFQWHPYVQKLTNWDAKRLYKKNRPCIIDGRWMDSEVETLVQCWRTSELVGLDCMEQYLPQRVTMQFGFGQDMLGLVKRLSGEMPSYAYQVDFMNQM